MTAYQLERLLSWYGSADRIWRDFEKLPSDRFSRAYPFLLEGRRKGLEGVTKSLDKAGARAVFPDEEEYPEKLLSIPDRPAVLYVRGELSVGNSVCIVGSRQNTRYGRNAALRISQELAENGVQVISGMARGIDTFAHEGALNAKGYTLAVLGCGVDICYPPENRALMNRILDSGGAIVTEYPPGSRPLSYHFPLRNRIISGLSDALLLIEAMLHSGTNSTVNYALDQGREVFSLPGNVDSPCSELPLKLLREGANLCINGSDILQHMGWQERSTDSSGNGTNMNDPVLRLLSNEEKSFEELLVETGMDPSELNAHLTMLEFSESIEKHAGRIYSLKGR